MIIVLDLLLTPLAFIIFLVGFSAVKIFYRSGPAGEGRNLLVLSPSGYASVKHRGVEHLGTFDNDFFDKVYFFCPFSSEDHEIDISDRLKMIDIAGPWIFAGLQKIRLRYSTFILRYTYALFKIAEFAKSRQICIVRAMEPHVTGSMGILLKRLLGGTHVQDIRANFDLIYLGTGKAAWMPAGAPAILQALSRRCERLFEGFVFKHSDFVFGGNKNNLDYALYRGASLVKSAVVRVNIQPDLFEDLSGRENIREGLGMEGKLILFCGRLHEDKYPQDVIRAFEMLAARDEDPVLLLAGDGPERGHLEAMVSDGPLAGRVRFLGYCDNMFLKNLFVSVDLIVCPLGGSVLIEAALASLPVVAYDFEWHSELVIDGYSGLLVNFKNIAAMSAAMQFMLEHPAEAASFGRRAREIAVNLLSPEKIMIQERQIYADLLSSKGE